MTYAFEFRLENVKEGSEEAGKEVQRLKGVSIVSTFIMPSWLDIDGLMMIADGEEGG
jgi:hypothetical protein